jgi:hypothetical protein
MALIFTSPFLVCVCVCVCVWICASAFLISQEPVFV